MPAFRVDGSKDSGKAAEKGIHIFLYIFVGGGTESEGLAGRLCNVVAPPTIEP